MPRLGLGIHEFMSGIMAGGWVYIMSNRRDGTIYLGVTNDLIRRANEHREGLTPGFTKFYALKRLVYYELHETMPLAIQREKTVKGWPRAWKVRLISSMNPEWDDLYDSLF
jgi:putative endonuclease